MRVALFSDTYLPDVNGVARTLGRWVDFLQSKDVACKVFAPQSGQSPANVPFDRLVERFASIPFLLYPECRLAVPNPVQVTRMLDAFRPDLIHVATPFNMGLLGVRYAVKRGIPLVASYHTHFDHYLHHYRLQWMENMLWRYMLWFHKDCRKIYVPSPSAADHLRDKGFDNIEIWSRGVDTSRFRPISTETRAAVLRKYGIDASEAFVLLYVGRLAPEKSADLVLSAYRLLPDRVRRRAKLIFAGDGPLFGTLSESIKGDRNIVLPGFVHGNELHDLYAAADAFVFPSATETFGNVVLEAMASGTPVIGAAAGGVKDTVKDGGNGLLCEPGDAEAFARAIVRLHDDEPFRRALSQAGRAYGREQSWDQIFGRLLDSYRAVSGTLEQRRPRVTINASSG